MEIDKFLLSLLGSLANLDFVEKIDFKTEVFVLKGRSILKKNRFLQVYFNELTGTIAFALIEQDKRLWGVDFDNLRGWHLHPLKNADDHFNIAPMSIEEIVDALADVWALLP
ncbi:MAG: hypothetical protein JRE47_12030 [Deltaproteobacteria bacterium]|nr:hypothetical protein [Deltaproteobacteria bacterium]